MLTFQEEGHIYKLDEVELPSVTTILKELGFLETRFFKPEHAEAGKRRHKATELYDLGDLDWGSVDVSDISFLAAWIQFQEENECEWHGIEKMVYHERWKYAGTIDRYGVVNGAPTIVDIKTGSKAYWHKAQLCMYGACVKAGENRPNIMTVRLKDGKYKIDPYAMDEELADSIARTYKFKLRKE